MSRLRTCLLLLALGSGVSAYFLEAPTGRVDQPQVHHLAIGPGLDPHGVEATLRSLGTLAGVLKPLIGGPDQPEGRHLAIGPGLDPYGMSKV